MLTSDMGITEATTMRASWLIDGSGACAASDVTLRLRAGRVAAVEHGTAAETSSPAEERLDLGGWTLIPWLLDAHVHLFMTSTSDPEVRRKQLDSTYDGLLGSMKSNAAALLRAGVLAARDGGDYGGYSLRLRDEGLPGCPLRICSPGRAFRARGRYGRLIGRSPGEGESLAEAIRLELEERRPNHVKVVQSGLNSLVRFGRVTRPQFDLGQLREAVAVATRRGTPVMAHANGPAAVAIAIEAGCASVEHGFFMGEEALKRLAESHCVWVPTAVTMKGYAEQLPAGDSRRDVALQKLTQRTGLGHGVAAARYDIVQELVPHDAERVGPRALWGHGPVGPQVAIGPISQAAVRGHQTATHWTGCWGRLSRYPGAGR